jgi:hypothetical protein
MVRSDGRIALMQWMSQPASRCHRPKATPARRDSGGWLTQRLHDETPTQEISERQLTPDGPEGLEGLAGLAGLAVVAEQILGLLRDSSDVSGARRCPAERRAA